MFEEKRLPRPLYVQRSQSTAAIAEALAPGWPGRDGGGSAPTRPPRTTVAPFLETGLQTNEPISSVKSPPCVPMTSWLRWTCSPHEPMWIPGQSAVMGAVSRAYGYCSRPPLTSASVGFGSIAHLGVSTPRSQVRLPTTYSTLSSLVLHFTGTLLTLLLRWASAAYSGRTPPTG